MKYFPHSCLNGAGLKQTKQAPPTNPDPIQEITTLDPPPIDPVAAAGLLPIVSSLVHPRLTSSAVAEQPHNDWEFLLKNDNFKLWRKLHNESGVYWYKSECVQCVGSCFVVVDCWVDVVVGSYNDVSPRAFYKTQVWVCGYVCMKLCLFVCLFDSLIVCFLSVCLLSISLSVCLSVCLSVSVCFLSVCFSVCFFVCLFVCCLFVCLFVCLIVCSFVCLFAVCLFICLSVCLLVCLYLFVCILACLFVCLFVFVCLFLFVCLSLCLSGFCQFVSFSIFVFHLYTFVSVSAYFPTCNCIFTALETV